jgi:SAM-dependent methyltransferase
MALERIDPKVQGGALVLDHYGRYAFAAQFVAGKRVLDAACGVGYGSHLLKEAGAAEVIGVDLSGEAIAYAREHYVAPGITFHQANAEEMTGVEGLFDIVVSFETLEHLRNPHRFLHTCRQKVHDDALLLFSIPNEADHPPDNPYHLHFFNREHLDALVRDLFPARRILPLYFSLATVICGPSSADETARLHPVQSQLIRVDKIPPEAECYLALCSPTPRSLEFTNLLVHGRPMFEEVERDRRWLDEQRQAWQRAAEDRQAGLAYLEDQQQRWQQAAEERQAGIAWAEDQRRRWQQTAERAQEQLRAWRTVAQERDKALEELEHINQWLDAKNREYAVVQEQYHKHKRDLEKQRAELSHHNDQLRQELDQKDQELQHASLLIGAMQATLSWRVARKLHLLFPRESLTGRVVRRGVRMAGRGVRMAGRLFKRSA